MLVLLVSFAVRPSHAATRTTAGLQALYDFNSTSGPIVTGLSRWGAALGLEISDPKAVKRSEGSLSVRGKTLIRTQKPAVTIIESIRRSGEITIEAWIQPAKIDQSGPARIITLSKNASERNFTLGQDGDRFEVRFRTTETSDNGIPSLSSGPKSLTTELTHVVYTRSRSGQARLYLNGEAAAEQTIKGDTSNWNRSHRLALANELSKDRPWQGTYHLVAIYNRDLTPDEIKRNFEAGAGAETTLAQDRLTPGEHLFETQVAPLLAKHCLECHDSSTRKGGLDLSRRDTALAGSKHGEVILPGNAAESPLWESVDANDMPDDRPPLSAREKKMLQQWIDEGATWSLETIDPAIYTHDRQAGTNWVRRLTVEEYIATVESTVGVDIDQEAREILPPDLRADGFSNTAYNLIVDLKHVEAYARLAEIIVSRMDVIDFAAEYSQSRKLTDESMRGLISKMGNWVLRGPVEDREVDSYRGISTTVASAGGNFKDAVGFILEAMLQSPRFLYRMENQRGDGGRWPVDEYELASRMSYIVWGAPPDRELLKAAEEGRLFDSAGVETQVERMLEDPRAIERSTQFLHDWLDLDRMDHLRPSPERFPNWDPNLAPDMREETIAFFKEVVWNQKRPLSELLNAQVTYATARLAAHYGLEPAGKGLSRYDLSSVPGRGGLLTQGSVLTVGGDDASTVTRGLFVFHDLLRGVVKDPPPGIDTTPVPTRPGLSQRAIATERIANRSCGACHSKFEPLSFGLARFDGLGAYHEVDEHGNDLRDDGEILFPGAAKPVSYGSSGELMDLLAGSERVSKTLTWKVTQFALGRPLVSADARIVDSIHEKARKEGGTYANLISAIVLSDLVQTTRTETH